MSVMVMSHHNIFRYHLMEDAYDIKYGHHCKCFHTSGVRLSNDILLAFSFRFSLQTALC